MTIMEETLLKRRLSDRGLRATDQWLSTNVQSFKESNEQYTVKELEDFIFDQWLLVDLRDLKFASFPPSLANKRKIVLTSQYTCQIESVLDIGHSAYSQYQKITKKDTSNLEVDTETDNFQNKWEPKASKTLMLYISDGVQEMRAMEFKPVSMLNTSIVPGTKAMIKGPVLCRRGIIMLEEGKISLLGGKVDKYIIPNAYENLLATVLELPLNPNPSSLGLNNEEDPPDRERENGNAQATRAANRHIPAPVSQVTLPSVANSELRPALPANQRVSTAVSQSSSQQYQSIEDDFPDDDALLNIDLDFEAEFQNQHNVQISGGGTTSNRLDREQPRPNSTSTRADKQPKQTSSNISRNSEPEFRNQHTHSNLGQSTSNIQKSSRMKQNSIASYLTAREPSNVNQDLKSNRNPQSTSYGASTSNAVRYDAGPCKSKNSTNPGLSQEFIIEEDDEDMLLAASLIDCGVSSQNDSLTSTTHVNTVNPNPSHSKRKNGAVLRENNYFEEDDDVCILEEDVDDEVLLNGSKKKKTAQLSHDIPARYAPQPDKISLSPFVYIAHVKDILGRNNERKRVCVKAVIVKVTEKISVSDGEWRLGVEITDGSANLPVRFSSELVSKIFEMTPAELSAWRKAAAQEPAKKGELKKHFERAQAKLLNIESIFEIDLTRDQGACVVNVREVTAKDVAELQKRSLPK